MRTLICLSALLLSQGCRKAEETPPPATQAEATSPDPAIAIYAGEARDRMCLAQGGSAKAGFITFGEGDANCSVRGAVQRSGDRLTIAPPGDESCRIEGRVSGDTVTLGPVAAACSYYCGPKASFAGKTFRRTAEAAPATDFAGDPLC
jgi:hypothetical protein